MKVERTSERGKRRCHEILQPVTKKLFFHLLNYSLCNACGAEASIVKEVLHGYIFCKVAEKCNAIIGAVVCEGIAERAHFFGISNKAVEAFNAAACSGFGGRLRDGVYAHFFA